MVVSAAAATSCREIVGSMAGSPWIPLVNNDWLVASFGNEIFSQTLSPVPLYPVCQ